MDTDEMSGEEAIPDLNAESIEDVELYCRFLAEEGRKWSFFIFVEKVKDV